MVFNAIHMNFNRNPQISLFNIKSLNFGDKYWKKYFNYQGGISVNDLIVLGYLKLALVLV